VKTLFLLGSERSGSTWVANALDAHPEVELLMEPCADYTRLFPGLPERERPLPCPTPEQVAAFRSGLDALPPHKYALLFRPGRPGQLRRVDRALLRALRRAAALLGRRAPLFALRHELLNLHAAALPAERLGAKAARPALRVVKELRLNLQLPLVARALPDARVAVMLRQPVAQIASILRRFESGGLGELRRSLARAFPGSAGEPRLARFRARIAAADPEGDPIGTLALWWVIQHEVLLEDLAASGLPFWLVSHEALCAAPERETAALLRFAGLAPRPEVTGFLDWSSRSDGDRNDPVDTRRVSARVPLEALAGIPPALRSTIEEALALASRGEQLPAPLAGLLERSQEVSRAH
jgi:hypothetical protein